MAGTKKSFEDALIRRGQGVRLTTTTRDAEQELGEQKNRENAETLKSGNVESQNRENIETRNSVNAEEQDRESAELGEAEAENEARPDGKAVQEKRENVEERNSGNVETQDSGNIETRESENAEQQNRENVELQEKTKGRTIKLIRGRDGVERINRGITLRPDLLQAIQLLAVRDNCYDYQLIEEALEDYLRKRKQAGL